LAESIRVEKFRHIANTSDDDDEDDTIDQLSELMSQSHHSLNTLYECSHENLNKLVAISKDFGVGARLTGAGWGGCIVALSDSITTCDQYITTLKKSYYDKIPHAKSLDLDNVVFATVRKIICVLS
jgi:N-acetylgalactosamine kinase